MDLAFERRHWRILKIIVLITVAVPIGITVYELTILGKTSVVFLGDYPAAVGILVLIYYGILLTIGVGWIIGQGIQLINLKNERTKNELLHLQSQVSPHFFFNMLNNLYGLLDKDVEKSKNLILKLSDLMRYGIYEGERKRVPLQKEVDYLCNYMELHRMRYHKAIDIRFETDMQVASMEIMPLLLIILLENAFKHGVENVMGKAFVHVRLTADENSILFLVENNFDTDELTKSTGIGIKNLKRRLELAYPNRHTLTLANHNSVYTAKLELRR
ncbi:MAG: histidine kinase [Pricia sp.]